MGFDPIPFDAEAARIYGRICAAVISAAGSRAAGWPTPGDLNGLDDLLTVVQVTRSKVPRDG